MSIKVLVVDDEYLTRELLRMVLERRNCEISEAGDGREALRKIEEDCPDVVVLDVMMPNMNGIETVEAIRANEGTTELPVIMISAKSHQIAVKEGLAAGANEYLSKPVDQRKLIKLIHELAPSVVV